METGAASQDTDASGGLSIKSLGMIIEVAVPCTLLVVAFITCLFGDRLCPRLWKFIRRRREGRSQGPAADSESKEFPALLGESRASQSSTNIPSSEHDSAAENRGTSQSSVPPPVPPPEQTDQEE